MNKCGNGIFRCSEIFTENSYLCKINWLVGGIRRSREGMGKAGHQAAKQ